MKTLIPFIIVISLAAGYGIGVNRSQTPENRAPEPVLPKVDANTRSLQTLIDHDYLEYLRLQKLEDQYKKADEILGKIMQLFLADLSLHFTPELKTAILAKSNPVAAAQTPAHEPLQLPPSTPAYQVKPQPTEMPATAADKKPLPPEEFKKLWNTATVLKDEPAHLSGCFEGTAKMSDPTDLWKVLFFHRFDQGASGQNMLIITSDRGVDSRTRGIGSNKNIRGMPDQPDAVLLQPNPNTVFQMFYNPTHESWSGNVYTKKNSDSDYKMKGVFELVRGTHCIQP